MSDHPVSNVLLVKLGAIGDCLMLVPGAEQLLQQHRSGDADRVDWVCGSSVAPLLALYPWIRPIAVDEGRFLHGSITDRVRCLLALWPKLAQQRYRAAVTVYYDPRYRLLSLPVRAERRISLSHVARGSRLIPGRHHTDEFARVLTRRQDDVRPTALRPIPPPVSVPGPLGRRVGRRSVLVPGGARNLLRDDALRRWPVEHYVKVARVLVDRGHEVVLAGGSGDRWVLPAFAGLPVTNLIGEISLVQTLGLFGEADLVLTHDTGPMHLAGLTSTPLLAVFGPTDPHGRLPQRPGTMALWGGERFACRPCYDGQDYAACHRNACVEEVTPELAIQAIDYLLANPDLPPTVVPPSLIPLLGRGSRRAAE